MRAPVHANFGLAESTETSINLYLSSFPGEKVCFHTQIGKMDNEKKMHRGSFGFSEYPQGKQKNYTERKNRREPLKSRFRGMMRKMGLTSLPTSKFYGS